MEMSPMQVTNDLLTASCNKLCFDTTDQNVLPLRLQYPTGIKEHIFVLILWIPIIW